MTVNQAGLMKRVIAMAGLLFVAGCQGETANPDYDGAQDGEAIADALHFAAPDLGQDEPLVAHIGDSPISLEAVRREMARRDNTLDVSQLGPGDPVFDQTLLDLIDQRLLALEAVRRGLYNHPSARERLAAAEERILSNVLVEDVVSSTVSEAAIERLYREQLELIPTIEEIRARHILIDTREEAEQVARLLAEGADFSQLASQVSQDPATRFNGGDLGYFTYDAIVPDFARVAYATLEGQISAPFQTEYGWHVLEVIDRRQQPRPSLEEMRGSIVRFLTLQGMDGLLASIRDEYPVELSYEMEQEGIDQTPAEDQNGEDGL